MVESGNCCWKTDLGVVLTPLIKTGHVFGSNWLMYSKFSAFHWLLKIYGVAHYLLSVFLLIVLCLHINSSDGIQAKTLIKLMFFVHVLVGMTSHTFNIRVQNQMSDLLEKFAILKNKKLGLNNVKLRIFGYVISFVTIFLTVCSTAGFYAILVGPLKSVFKLNTFGRYEFDVLVTILFYLPTSALSIAFQYNLILSFTSFCLCETYHTGIKSFSDSIAAINDWDKEYHLFLNLVDFLNDLMGWHIFLYNGIFFIHLILNLVLFASTASQFPPDTIFVYLCWSTGSALAVMLNFITVIKVNEAVGRTIRLLALSSVSAADTEVKAKLYQTIKTIEFRGSQGISAAKFFYPSRMTFLTMIGVLISYFIIFIRMTPSVILTQRSTNVTDKIF